MACPICQADENARPSPKFCRRHERDGSAPCQLAKDLRTEYRRKKRTKSAQDSLSAQRALQAGAGLEAAARLEGITVAELQRLIRLADKDDRSNIGDWRKGRRFARALAEFEVSVSEKALNAVTPRYSVKILEMQLQEGRWSTESEDSVTERWNAYSPGE